MEGPLTINDIPPELLIEVFQHLAELEPLGILDYPNDDVATTLGYSDLRDSSKMIVDAGRSEDGIDRDYHYHDYYEGSMSASPTYSLAWTRATHVCGRWRSVALSSPSLWTAIPFNLPRDWLLEVIRRAQQAPLDIYIPEASWYRELMVLLCELGDRHRFRRIACENANAMTFNMLGPRLLKGREFDTDLEELDVVTTSFPAADINAFRSMRKLSVTFKLCEPDFGAFDQNAATLIPPSLTELRLAVTSLVDPQDYTLSSHWIGTLPNLVVLDLDHLRFEFPIGQDEIFLPRLRELRIAEARESCGYFVRFARMPHLRKYTMQYNKPVYPTTTNLTGVRAMGFGRVLDDVDESIPPLHTLSLSQFLSSFSGLIHVHGWRFGHTGNDEDDLRFPIQDTETRISDADISHNVIWDNATGDDTTMANFATVLLSHPALSSLRMLSLDLHPRLDLGDVHAWTDLFQPMRQLRHLRITSPRSDIGLPKPILDALVAHPWISDGFVLPFMERLTLVDWDPKKEQSGDDLRTLALLRVNNTPLKSVHIVSWRRCFDEDWQERLAELEGVATVYEHLFVPLDRIRATDEEDSGPDYEYEEYEGSDVDFDDTDDDEEMWQPGVPVGMWHDIF
ncbi:unnamed protein product [Peniophora sp. CBMAI 1063]|nr:unnamed protein product [Peniophora sp. CBMAI 1063]